MNFVTLEFAFFFLIVLVAGWAIRAELYRPFLLLCNLVFYACAGLVFVPLLLTVAVLDWGTARLLFRFAGRPQARKAIIALSITVHVCLLAFFKYYEFLLLGLESLASFGGFGLGGLGEAFAATDILFPVGLSFYTFQGLSYAIDQYRSPETEPRSFTDVLLFVSFFPTIMAGPIMRAHQFLPQLERREEDTLALQEGFALILSGLFKKVVIASYLSEHIVRDVFQSPEFYSSWTVLAAVYGYSIQIFCDFSGYSDMAIGIARLMGYRLPENFRSPYLALNIQDFWRRWHITLSLWLRDYLYIPLGGSRRGNRYLNLVITMGLGGLWHGSHVRFLIWGVMHGLGLAVVHAFHTFRKQWADKRAAALELTPSASVSASELPVSVAELTEVIAEAPEGEASVSTPTTEAEPTVGKAVETVAAPDAEPAVAVTVETVAQESLAPAIEVATGNDDSHTELVELTDSVAAVSPAVESECILPLQPKTAWRERLLHWAGVGGAWLLTFHFVSFLWVFFRAEDMERSLEILRRVFVFGQSGEGFPVLVIPAVLAGLLIQIVGGRLFRAFVGVQTRLPWAAQALVLALLGGLILKLGPDGVMPFIYFQF